MQASGAPHTPVTAPVILRALEERSLAAAGDFFFAIHTTPYATFGVANENAVFV